MKIWLITDTHFGHHQMIEYCGRPQGFEELILKNLKNVLKPEDVLLHLGDFCIGDDEAWAIKYRELLGKKWLLKGNHDHKSNAWYLGHGFDFVGDQLKDTYFGKKVCLSHYPQYWDGWFDVSIHGHFHNTDHRRVEEEMLKRVSGYTKLLALEYTKYQPITLENFIQ